MCRTLSMNIVSQQLQSWVMLHNRPNASNKNNEYAVRSSHQWRNRSLLPGRSYVLALDLWEQLMCSAFNSIQLQCWIMSLNTTSSISVVEPQVTKGRSILGFSFTDDTLPIVSDVFDMDTWYTQWPERGPQLAPFITRADFIAEIKHFPKKVILVHQNFNNEGRNNTYECKFTGNIGSLMRVFEQYPLLKVVRKVCILNGIPATEFNKLVFGDVSIPNTVVVFRSWRGFGAAPRLSIRGTPCAVSQPPYSLLRPSASIVKDAETFANKHLGGFNSYVSVSGRFEKLPPRNRVLSLEQRRKVVADAISKSIPMIASLKRRSGVNNTYLAYDYGQFGSRTFKHKLYHASNDLLIKFQEDVYDGKLSYGQYNGLLSTFKFQNPGYVAMVQMTLSSKAKCLFVIGSGNSINFVISLFKAFHHEGELCVSCLSQRLCSIIKTN